TSVSILSRAEFEEELVASGSFFFLKFAPLNYVLFFRGKCHPSLTTLQPCCAIRAVRDLIMPKKSDIMQRIRMPSGSRDPVQHRIRSSV
ncbi:MAG: hypothetical protein J5633_10440, partial [Oscillospiraceae bacterium]|nr:hypothetical protein [Oscillospiraceae bacterium]